jgi:hypothetical protein
MQKIAKIKDVILNYVNNKASSVTRNSDNSINVESTNFNNNIICNIAHHLTNRTIDFIEIDKLAFDYIDGFQYDANIEVNIPNVGYIGIPHIDYEIMWIYRGNNSNIDPSQFDISIYKSKVNVILDDDEEKMVTINFLYHCFYCMQNRPETTKYTTAAKVRLNGKKHYLKTTHIALGKKVVYKSNNQSTIHTHTPIDKSDKVEALTNVHEHCRQVRCGKGRKQTKVVYIKPFLRHVWKNKEIKTIRVSQ